MNICRVQNKDIVTISICGISLDPDEIYQINDNERQVWIDNPETTIRVMQNTLVIGNENLFFAAPIDQLTWLANKNATQVEVSKSTPFANPEYRTENNASNAVVEVNPSESQNIDLLIEKEIYVSGGEVVVFGSEEGDFLSAHVAYGPKILSTYIKKRWVSQSGFMVLDTRPLIAKLPRGVSLRLIYTASSLGSKRRVFVNYDMAVKL